jgi:Secretion system C-terminal sorting domain
MAYTKVMKQAEPDIVKKNRPEKVRTVCAILFLLLLSAFIAKAQAVTEVITDYNGYWKSTSSIQNPIKPDNDHNLLAFKYNGITYSTGVNDASLTAHAQSFAAGNFRSLPMQTMTGVANSNTKIGLGAMKDGVNNGAGAAPSRSLAQYLDDGPNGLNLGTGIANLPSGSLFLSVGSILTTNIGDNIPDMLITQIADPSGSYDRYEFTDINGNRVGNYVDIVLTSITPVGKWVADFYEATGSAILSSGYTQTQRDIRLWAADFSSFGINASNVGQIAYFKITLSGTSDLAFVAYNTTTITLNSSLALPSVSTRATRTPSGETGSKTLLVYPNPAKQQVTMSHDVARSGELLVIYNMQGVQVSKAPVDKGSTRTTLNLGALTPGCYQVTYTNGTDKNSQMLVIR